MGCRGAWKPFLLLVALSILPVGCGGKVRPAASAPSPTFEYSFDGQRALQDIKTQCAFGPRVPGQPGHARCAKWIQSQLQKTADEVTLQRFEQTLGGKSVNFTNIIAVYGRQTPRSLALCAHWDTRPFADQELDADKAAKPIPGANDGASGVAVLLEMGRLFKQKPPPDGVVMVFFDGEDYGKTSAEMFIGSRYFAKRWKSVLPVKPWRGILLDMVGAADIRIPREAMSDSAAPELLDAIYQRARDANLSHVFPDEAGKPINDDHIPLIEAGIPTVDLISFEYAWWHTLEDTPDKCSASSLKAVGEVVARTVYDSPR